MTPYYANAGITLYHGDCREVLLRLASESVSLILTDPPYGQNWRSNSRAQRFDFIEGDHDQEVALDGLRAAVRLLTHSAHLYVFGRFDLSALPVTIPMELVWDKVAFNAGNLELPWANQHEYIQFCAKKSRGEVAKGAGRLAARLRKGSVLRHPRICGTGVRDHPTEKPVMLLRELIESSSCFGDTVLDPFVGIGSTLVAAALEARRAIGIEIEEQYCEVAARRLSQGFWLWMKRPRE